MRGTLYLSYLVVHFESFGYHDTACNIDRIHVENKTKRLKYYKKKQGMYSLNV